MKTIGQAATEFGHWAKTEQAKRMTEWAKAPSLTQLLSEVNANSARCLLPKKLPVAKLAETTTAHELQTAAKRVDECARCPKHGGACVNSYATDWARGHTAIWNDHESRLAEQPCAKWKEFVLRERLTRFGVPERMLDATLDNFTVANDVRDLALAWAKAWGNEDTRGSGVHLYGASVGTGKTHLSCALLRGLVANRRVSTAMFLYVPKFLSDLRDSFDLPMHERRDWLDRIMACDLVVLDDLGAEKTTEWVREQLGIVVNERWSNKRAMIVTSNLTIDKYRSTIGDRAASRLAAMCPFAFRLNGKDQRASR